MLFLISVVTVGFMSENITVSEETAEAGVRVCASLPETLTITRNVSVTVRVQQREGEAEGQLNRHTWQSSLHYFQNSADNFNFLFLLQWTATLFSALFRFNFVSLIPPRHVKMSLLILLMMIYQKKRNFSM